MNTDRCVSCGEVIPEGREVCGACEDKIVLKTNEQYTKGYEQGVRDFAKRIRERDRTWCISEIEKELLGDKNGLD
jgi:hypothetical protein